MTLFSEHPADRIAEVLAPHLGGTTADAVARHLCARHGVADGSADRGALDALREDVRRGLVAFVGLEQANQLAEVLDDTLQPPD